MKYLTQETIKELTEAESRAPAITIYLPTHRAPTPPNMSEDQLRLKNLTEKAIDILKNRNEPHDFIEFVRKQCAGLHQDRSFWQSQLESLLICIRPNEVQTFNLPIDCDEYVAVDDHFHLAPVYAFLSDEQEYYVLALAQHDPKLYKGNMYELKSTDIELPSNIEEALNIDELHLKSVQYHTGNQGGATQIHGHGGAKDTGDSERLRFFSIVDNKITQQADKKLPLIIAGTDSEVTEYKSLSRYPKIMEDHISGNYTGVNPNDLYKKAKPVIEKEIILSEHADVLERFQRLSGENDNLVATSYADIKDAAEKGRIETLAVGMSRKTRDTVRDNDEQVTKITFSDNMDSKAMDYIAQLVWSQSGKVVNMYENQMPQKRPMFAIMRY